MARWISDILGAGQAAAGPDLKRGLVQPQGGILGGDKGLELGRIVEVRVKCLLPIMLVGSSTNNEGGASGGRDKPAHE
jgi:hypothetical protein